MHVYLYEYVWNVHPASFAQCYRCRIHMWYPFFVLSSAVFHFRILFHYIHLPQVASCTVSLHLHYFRLGARESKDAVNIRVWPSCYSCSQTSVADVPRDGSAGLRGISIFSFGRLSQSVLREYIYLYLLPVWYESSYFSTYSPALAFYLFSVRANLVHV